MVLEESQGGRDPLKLCWESNLGEQQVLLTAEPLAPKGLFCACACACSSVSTLGWQITTVELECLLVVIPPNELSQILLPMSSV